MKKEPKYPGVTPVRPEVDPCGRYTVGTCAKLLGVSRSTVQNAIRRGEILPINPLSGWPRVEGGELLRYWDAKTSK